MVARGEDLPERQRVEARLVQQSPDLVGGEVDVGDRDDRLAALDRVGEQLDHVEVGDDDFALQLDLLVERILPRAVVEDPLGQRLVDLTQADLCLLPVPFAVGSGPFLGQSPQASKGVGGQGASEHAPGREPFAELDEDVDRVEGAPPDEGVEDVGGDDVDRVGLDQLAQLGQRRVAMGRHRCQLGAAGVAALWLPFERDPLLAGAGVELGGDRVRAGRGLDRL